MKLRIKASAYETMVARARDCLPNEACGLIAGGLEDGTKIVEKAYPLTNLDNSHEHFSMDPKEQLSAIKDMRANGLTPLGNFHSHPATPARPSPEDIRLAHDPKASYLILSLAEAAPVLKAFGISKGEVSPQEVEIEPSIYFED